jgi:hypothetical protein
MNRLRLFFRSCLRSCLRSYLCLCVRLCLCAGMLCAMTGTAYATNFQDLWWNPAESGWGVNVNQQGETVFATWFVYDAARKPTWFVATATKQPNVVSNQVFTGDLLQANGTGFASGVFVPLTAADITNVGKVSFTFSDARTGTLVYSVNGQTVTKQITRQFLAALPIAGNYIGGSQRSVTGCTNAALNGSILNQGTINVTVGLANGDNGAITIAETSASLCRYTGTYRQFGSTFEGTGNFTCAGDGSVGTWTGTEGAFNERVLSMKLALRLPNETCNITVSIGGFKP